MIGKTDAESPVVKFDDIERRICFVGVSIFVQDEFLQEMKEGPRFWVGPELTRRVLGNDSPVLTDEQVRNANSAVGMNLMVWEAGIHAEFEKNGAIHRRIIQAFIESHRGYLWKEIIASHLESVERLQWTLQTGGLLWDPESSRWVDSPKKDPKKIIEAPHLVGISREIELSRPASWAGSLFQYQPPQIHFSKSEQQLLISALSHKTDEELSEQLKKSPSTIKNTGVRSTIAPRRNCPSCSYRMTHPLAAMPSGAREEMPAAALPARASRGTPAGIAKALSAIRQTQTNKTDLKYIETTRGRPSAASCLSAPLPASQGAVERFRASTIVMIYGGGRGIRTPERLSTLTVFKTAGFSHSPIPPPSILQQLTAPET